MPTELSKEIVKLRAWWAAREWVRLPSVLSDSAPLDLRIVGRMLFHAALVGVAAGLVGAAFFGLLEWLQHLLLEDLAGYRPLRASGESVFASSKEVVYRPWLLLLLPAAGGLLCGLIARYAPEVRGGGGDSAIEAFHHRGGLIRLRVIWAK